MLTEQAPKLGEKKNGVKGIGIVISRNPGAIIWPKILAIMISRARKREYKSSKALISWEKTSYFVRRYVLFPKRTLSPNLYLRTWTVPALTILREHRDIVDPKSLIQQPIATCGCWALVM